MCPTQMDIELLCLCGGTGGEGSGTLGAGAVRALLGALRELPRLRFL